MNMKIQNLHLKLKNYAIKKYDNIFNKPKYCYLPHCHARCCSSAPIPDLFLKFVKPEKQVRKIFMTVPAPQTNPYCKDAVIPITKPLDKLIKPSGKTKDGRKVFELDLAKVLNAEDNFCPYLTDYGRCNIYDFRPKVCRDFGNDGWFKCYEKLNLKELLTNKLLDLYDTCIGIIKNTGKK